MIPRGGSSSVLLDTAAPSLADRLEVVRSYVQEQQDSGDSGGEENSDDSSVASLGGSDELLPKERAYSVGCKPPMMSGQLRLSGAGRPPKVPGSKTAEKSSSADVSRQRHQESCGGSASSGGARARKISVTNRPEHFPKQSGEAASSKSSVPASSLDVDRGLAEGTMRPRTSTLPWDLLKGVRNGSEDLHRPRSSSGGHYAASVRDAVRSRISAGHRSSLVGESSVRPDPIYPITPNRELTCPSEGQEVGEYVEMHCPVTS